MSNDQSRKKDTDKLRGRFNLDYIYQETEDPQATMNATLALSLTEEPFNPALRRLEALRKELSVDALSMGLSPIDIDKANWVEVGPIAITNGQTYGGADVIITGRVTAICPHPSDPNTIYLGSSRGGIWKTTDSGTNWYPMSDHSESLAIGSLDISQSDPEILYAGTGEGNLQLYSSTFPLNSAPGIYLGIGVLKSTDGGATWDNFGTFLFANESFYRIAIDPANSDRVFAATSKGLCRTLDGETWNQLPGGGLPAISSTVIACTDVLIDRSDISGNTVFVAFWADGIYKSTNALSGSPTWVKLTTGLPAGNAISRISLASAPSSPNTKFALFATNGDTFHSVCKTTNAIGTSWSQIISSGVSLYGAFTSNIAVDPTTPNILYISGVELYKATFSGAMWNVSNIGQNIHPDNHAFAFHPTDNLILYSGNDGGIYKSTDGGITWEDSINIGLNLLQYEGIDDHPNSDAIVLGGTQDNGTNTFRNSSVFYHADDGDGGYCSIDNLNGNRQISSYFGISFKRSTSGGNFGSWSNIASGIIGSALFYPPLTNSPTSSRVAVGTNRINVNDGPYTGGSWTQITLPGITGRVSAISFASDNIIYAATTSGEAYKATLSGGTWTTQRLDAPPLPGGWIWDIIAFPGSVDRVLVVFANFGITDHAWTGVVPATGTAAWTATSGSGTTALPDVPYYAIAFEDDDTIYVGSDIGVFKTDNAGTSWANYSHGLPNTAIYDLRFYEPNSLLRAATHGRGLWEIKTDQIPSPLADLYFKDNAMHTGRLASAGSVKAGFEDTLQNVSLNDNLYWWQSVNIKVDSPTSLFGGYQFSISEVDFLVYQTQLQHDNPEKGNINRVYVCVQNRGPNSAQDVQVKLMYTGASAGLPELPADFWSQFPNDPTVLSPWNSIGVHKTISNLEPLKPTILEWDWNPPISADTHSCILVVMDSMSDPILNSNKVLNISQLLPNEKRVALKNLHLVNLVSGISSFIPFHFNELQAEPYKITVDFGRKSQIFTMGIVFPGNIVEHVLRDSSFRGFKLSQLGSGEVDLLRKQWIEKEYKDPDKVENYIRDLDFKNFFIPNSKKAALSFDNEQQSSSMKALLVAINERPSRSYSKFSIIQENGRGRIMGGSTFILRN